MAINFITEDPVGTGYDRQFNRNEAIRKRDEAIGTDQAMRAGVQDMLSQRGQGVGYQSPAASFAASPTPPVPPASDDDYAVRTIAAEAGSEPDEGQAAVGHVIQNRLASGKWGNSYQSVVTAPQQFSPWNADSGNDPRTIDPNSPRYQKAAAIWAQVKAGQIPDPTGGARHFANPQASTASWVQPALSSGNFTRIGNHVFFRGLSEGEGSGSGGDVSAVPQPPQQSRMASYDPIIARLATTPGGGKAALPLLQGQRAMDIAADRNATSLYGQQLRATTQQNIAAQRAAAAAEIAGERRKDGLMRVVANALVKGDIPTAMTYADQAGYQIPDHVLNNAERRQRMGVGLKLAQNFYRRDPERSQKFLQAYVQTGSVDQAYQTAGPPENDQNFRLVWLQDGEKEALYSVRGGVASPVTVGGQPPASGGQPAPATGMQPPATSFGATPAPTQPPAQQPSTQVPGAGAYRQPPGRHGGNETNLQTRIRLARENGATPADIDDMVNGRELKPSSVASLLGRITSQVGQDFRIKPSQKQQAIEDQMNALVPSWKKVLNGRTGGLPGANPPPSPSSPAPAAPGARPRLPEAQRDTYAPTPQDLNVIGGTASGYGQRPTVAAPPAAVTPPAPSIATAPAPTTPQRPASVPQGSQYSPSRKMWRDPSGNLYDENGQAVRRPQG